MAWKHKQALERFSKRRYTWKSLETVPLQIKSVEFELKKTVWNRSKRVL